MALAVDPTTPSNPNPTSGSSEHLPEAAPRCGEPGSGDKLVQRHIDSRRRREAPFVLVVVTAAVRVVVSCTCGYWCRYC